MYKKLKILSRKSELAKIQANLVGEAITKIYKNTSVEFHTSESIADLDQTIKIYSSEQVGLFTKDISQKLINDDFDIAVHSWKDIPITPTDATSVVCTLDRGDMRDLIIFKKEVSFENIDYLEVLTSSPRRQYNLSKVLSDIIPVKTNKLLFKDIRGNIETRLEKFDKGHSHAIIIAKVALDRMLQFGKFDTKKRIKEIVQKNKWVLLPLSFFPTAPGQGAIGIEVKKNRKNLIRFLNKINFKNNYENILEEKKIMSQYGGGCQQKIGVSIWEKHGKKIISLSGKTDDEKILKKYSLLNHTIANDLKLKDQNIYPVKGIDENIFERKSIDNTKKIKGITRSLIYLSRKNVLENSKSIHKSNIIWTSGVSCWKYAVKQGVWVNGTSDSFGESEPLHISNLISPSTNYFKLSHSKASESNFKLIPTYHLHLKQDIIKNLDIKSKDSFYWMSSFQFDEFLRLYPEIIVKKHSCGLGNTFNHIVKIIPKNNKITPYLSYKIWLEKNLKEKTR